MLGPGAGQRNRERKLKKKGRKTFFWESWIGVCISAAGLDGVTDRVATSKTGCCHQTEVGLDGRGSAYPEAVLFLHERGLVFLRAFRNDLWFTFVT